MLEFLFFIVIIVILWKAMSRYEGSTGGLARKPTTPQLARALEYGERLYGEKKYLAAEKAYLAVLKLDHRSLLAYNRLGIIYSAQKNMGDAIECFEIATRLLPSATTYLNLGLAFYENKNYIKAIAAIQKSIMFEPSAQRYIALAKAHHRISDSRGTIEALEKAVEIDATKSSLTLLRDAYRQAGKKELAEQIMGRLKEVATA